MRGPGIRINKGNQAKIKGCEITQSKSGIEVVSAQPTIVMNTIEKNHESGIISMTRKDLRCDALIKYNTIQRNKDCGIVCTGENNFTRIEKNLCVNQNAKAGIKAENDAQISITNNKIAKNFGQGILLVESTWAHIEANEINENFKANIALGGAKAADSVILRNEIKSSRCEGIFLIETGFCWIHRNTIEDNADGIVMFDSTPHLAENQISNSMRSGVMCCGSSFPKMEKNQIYGNHQSGLNFRENSEALMIENKVFMNYYQLSSYTLNR